MTNGIYTVEFHASTQLMGKGIAVVRNGFIHGGDFGYLYLGTLEVSGDSLTASIRVEKHDAAHISVMGPISNFDLNLSGMFKPGADSFNLNGQSPQIPGQQIQISGIKKHDLAQGSEA